MAYFETDYTYDGYKFYTGNLFMGGSVQHKRASASEWESSVYVPFNGEICVATDTGEIRVGNGVDTWSNLPNPYKKDVPLSEQENNPMDTISSIRTPFINDAEYEFGTNDYYIVFNTTEGKKNYKLNLYSFEPDINQFSALANLIAPLTDYEIDSICIEKFEYNF